MLLQQTTDETDGRTLDRYIDPAQRTTSATTVLWSINRSKCAIQHLQLITDRFCCSRLTAHRPCWSQLMHKVKWIRDKMLKLSAMVLLRMLHTHTNTYPFNGPLSGTIWVSQYQKVKSNVDFTEARDSEWQWHQLVHMQACTSLQADNHASTPPLSFLQAGCPSCCQTNSVKTLKAMLLYHNKSECFTIADFF